jgi:chromate transporter
MFFDIFTKSLKVGFLSFGGPAAHLGLLERVFVRENAWVTPQHFSELIALTSALPGPASAKLVIAVGTFYSQSILGGLSTFLAFSAPSAVILMFLAYFWGGGVLPQTLVVIMNGFYCGCVAIVAQAAIRLSGKTAVTKLQSVIVAISAALYLLDEHFLFMLLLLAVGAVIALADPEFKPKVASEGAEDPLHDLEGIANEKIMGYPSVILFFGLLGSLYAMKLMMPDSKLMVLIEGFYRIGAVVFGGGHVVLPMMMAEFVEGNHLLTSREFLDAFVISSFLPGPMTNISCYLGFTMAGFPGSVLAYIASFLPCFLSIWAVIPYWVRLRQNPSVSKGLKGVSCAAIGFIYTAIYLMYKKTLSFAPLQATSTIMVTFGVLMIHDLSAPVLILLGGCLRFILFTFFAEKGI